MWTIVLAASKGGAGKTTLAGHLAVEAARCGVLPVHIIDADEQGSLARWWNVREDDQPVLVKVPEGALHQTLEQLRRKGSKLVIIDTPGSHNPGLAGIIAEASLVIAPVIPSPHDLAAIYRTISMARDARKAIMFVLNNASATGKLTKQAIELLQTVNPDRREKPCIVASRLDFRSAMVGGHTVQELSTKGAQKAAEEVGALWSAVHSRLKELADGDQASAA